MKSTLALSLMLCLACSKKQDKPPAPSPEPVTDKVPEPAKAAYTPEAGKQAIAQLAACTSQYSCAAFDTVVGFGQPAVADLTAFVSDDTRPIDARRVAAIALGKLKAAAAGPKLVELGIASKDVTAQSDFLTAAGECGGDATFAAATAQYDKENHGDDNEHLVPLRYAIKAFPKQAMAWATEKFPKAKDQAKYADVITDVAGPSDTAALVALVGASKDVMVDDRLASKAIELGATDGKLWDVFARALASDSPYDHGDAGNFLAPIASKAPADKKAKLLELVKKALASDPKDSLVEDGLVKCVPALGG
ncbi:MAG TPA: hypothetical protein VLX92_21595 [Kofleriaceae bacterium]|nr:hypothetical protein [Kofleriaceae bacterium]